MLRLMVGLTALLVATLPTAARPRHHHGAAHRMSRSDGPGMPITAERDSIRINSVGQVISQPVPVIQKERAFDSRAQQELSKNPVQAAPQTPAPLP